MNLLSRDHKTPIKRLQDSYKLLTISYQEITAKHNKMLEYLNFFLLCTIFALYFDLYSRVKRYIPILKMAEELIGNLGYETLQSDTKCQSLEIASCIWARFTQKNSSQNLAKKMWKNFLIITKLSYQVRW